MNNSDRYARQRRQKGNEIRRVLAAKRFDHRTLPQLGRIAAYVFQQRRCRYGVKAAGNERIPERFAPLVLNPIDQSRDVAVSSRRLWITRRNRFVRYFSGVSPRVR
ncbi:hypothetical protein [Paraburkholderia sp. RAU2J]|uniref:hypothetical protein n=1 Tax=Paraburkholderia sp. RAU2J TaxID=1938810 RepID=UPI001F545EF0|nr:hypothetical protein [Paraburkholderia sp. RAU2J]